MRQITASVIAPAAVQPSGGGSGFRDLVAGPGVELLQSGHDVVVGELVEKVGRGPLGAQAQAAVLAEEVVAVVGQRGRQRPRCVRRYPGVGE
ncbi:hypothetical protein AB0C18_33760 [Nonomuraea muscovyensis]|uniref:hypothetical protein n=1 Tax=Nonomuraea muscovyensis TaxID=1124761 RepID=UPI0033E60699